MSDLFSNLELDFSANISNIDKIISSLSNFSNQKTEISISQAHDLINQAEKSVQITQILFIRCQLKTMEIEICSFNQNYKDKYQPKVRSYKYQLLEAKKALIRAEDNYLEFKTRDTLFSAGIDGIEVNSKLQLLIFALIKLSKTNYKQHLLSNAKKDMLENEQVADSIQEEQMRQREILQHSSNNVLMNAQYCFFQVQLIRQDLSTSNNLVSRMKRAIIKNKIICYGVILLVLALVALIIYFAFFPQSKNKSGNQSTQNNCVQQNAVIKLQISQFLPNLIQ